MKRVLFGCLVFFSLMSCDDSDDDFIAHLEDYIDAVDTKSKGMNVIACAAGTEGGIVNGDPHSTSVFYYPINGAFNVKYWETIKEAPGLSDYTERTYAWFPVFNGYLARFLTPDFTGEKWVIITYETNDSYHISDPILLKTNTKPTEINPSLVSVTENSVSPEFNWNVGQIDENVIYFQVVSELDGTLISGTYTEELNFTFYDTLNVVLNVSPIDTTPSIQSNENYNFTLMGVSEDNWVNMLSERSFSTN